MEKPKLVNWFYSFAENCFRKRFSNKVLPILFYDQVRKEYPEPTDDLLDELWEKNSVY